MGIITGTRNSNDVFAQYPGRADPNEDEAGV